jgi:hypothetical protein
VSTTVLVDRAQWPAVNVLATKEKVAGLFGPGKSLTEVHTAMGDRGEEPKRMPGIPYLSLAEIEYMAQVDRSHEIK